MGSLWKVDFQIEIARYAGLAHQPFPPKAELGSMSYPRGDSDDDLLCLVPSTIPDRFLDAVPRLLLCDGEIAAEISRPVGGP